MASESFPGRDPVPACPPERRYRLEEASRLSTSAPQMNSGPVSRRATYRRAGRCVESTAVVVEAARDPPPRSGRSTTSQDYLFLQFYNLCLSHIFSDFYNFRSLNVTCCFCYIFNDNPRRRRSNGSAETRRISKLIQRIGPSPCQIAPPLESGAFLQIDPERLRHQGHRDDCVLVIRGG